MVYVIVRDEHPQRLHSVPLHRFSHVPTSETQRNEMFQTHHHNHSYHPLIVVIDLPVVVVVVFEMVR